MLLGVGHLHRGHGDRLAGTRLPQRLVFGGHHYTHFFFTLEPHPPYAIRSVGSEFCIGRQRDPRRGGLLDCEVVQFVSGLAHGTGDALWLTYGVNDCSPRLAKLSLRAVLADLRPVYGHGQARGEEAAVTRGPPVEHSGAIGGSSGRSRATTHSRAPGSEAARPLRSSRLKSLEAEWPGYCGVTTDHVMGDCKEGDKGVIFLNRSVLSKPKEMGLVRSVCAAACASCSQCRYFSYSQRAGALGCSWYSTCNLTELIHRPAKVRTAAVHKASEPKRPRVLSLSQRLTTLEWAGQIASRLPGGRPVLVQVGANDHSKEWARAGSFGKSGDPVPALIRQGWAAVLYEPFPPAFARLQRRYEMLPRVQCVNKVVGECGSSDSLPFWHVDVSNATGNWGSPTADARCAENETALAWVNEISSLSRGYVVGLHGSAFHHRPEECERCAARLGRPLEADCLRGLIFQNTRHVNVSCAGTRLLRRDVRHALRVARQRAVQLLVVDAEGKDEQVLAAFPFGEVPVWRVIFEADRQTHVVFRRTAELLQAHGFRHVEGGKGPHSVWHNLAAP